MLIENGEEKSSIFLHKSAERAAALSIFIDHWERANIQSFLFPVYQI